MKKLLGILLLAVFVLTHHSAYAMNGNELVNNMRENQKTEKIDAFIAWKSGIYLGYVSGVFRGGLGS